jgi:hypothetical protein
MPGTPNQPKSAQQLAWEHLSPERQAALIAIADDFNAASNPVSCVIAWTNATTATMTIAGANEASTAVSYTVNP